MAAWQNFYAAEPFADPLLTADEQARVLGGMVQMWSERVDASSLQSWIWPRALAAAERFWSPQHVVLEENITVSRLQRASCQVLQRRGVRSGPVQPSFCPWSLDWD